jgi:uncharacterized protein YggE
MRIAACFLLAAAALPAQLPEVQKVTAHGVAEVSAKPDQVQIDIGVVTQAPSAQEAAATNAKQVSAVIADLKKAIGADGDIQTVNYYVHPNYSHPREGGGTPKISGYVATNVVRVTSGDVAGAGKLVDAATRTGANNVHGIQFSLKDESALRAKALAQAVKQARSNADAMAAALGMKVGQVLHVEDGAAPPPAVPLRRDMMMAQRAEAVSTPVEPGTIKVRAEATLTASLAP